MKIYILLSIVFLALATSVLAKGSTGGQPSGPTTKPAATNKPLISPTGYQVQNQNQVQTQNQGDSQQLSVKTREAEQLNQEVSDSVVKVSDQVQQLIETVGAKGGIGQQVKEIAQNQTQTQQEIKSDFAKINSQNKISRFFLGSDKKTVRSLSQKIDQNRLMIQQLEQLKTQTRNQGDLEQLQLTIDLMTYQNTSLQNKIDSETKSKGMFGWFLNLFSK